MSEGEGDGEWCERRAAGRTACAQNDVEFVELLSRGVKLCLKLD